MKKPNIFKEDVTFFPQRYEKLQCRWCQKENYGETVVYTCENYTDNNGMIPICLECRIERNLIHVDLTDTKKEAKLPKLITGNKKYHMVARAKIKH